MKLRTYIYTKLFKSGTLVGLEVNCHISNVTKENAERLKVGTIGSDYCTNAKWEITSGRWIESN